MHRGRRSTLTVPASMGKVLRRYVPFTATLQIKDDGSHYRNTMLPLLSNTSYPFRSLTSAIGAVALPGAADTLGAVELEQVTINAIIGGGAFIVSLPQHPSTVSAVARNIHVEYPAFANVSVDAVFRLLHSGGVLVAGGAAVELSPKIVSCRSLVDGGIKVEDVDTSALSARITCSDTAHKDSDEKNCCFQEVDHCFSKLVLRGHRVFIMRLVKVGQCFLCFTKLHVFYLCATLGIAVSA